MQLKFKVPTFRKGLNVTIRNASEKYLTAQIGESLQLEETNAGPIGTGMLIEAIPLNWRADQDVLKGLCRFEHDPSCHDISGLAQAMNHAYGLNEWGPDVVALLFIVGDDVVTEQQVDLSNEEITFGDPTPEAPASQPESPEPVEPPTSDEVPSEPQEAPVPRADEPEGSPMTKFHTDGAGTDWFYRVTEEGIIVYCSTDENTLTEAPIADSWPQFVIDFVERLEGR